MSIDPLLIQSPLLKGYWMKQEEFKSLSFVERTCIRFSHGVAIGMIGCMIVYKYNKWRFSVVFNKVFNE